jgi:aspartate/methionine/tyrosine aminotransferase
MSTHVLEKMIFDEVLPNHLLDTKYLQEYINSNNEDYPIPLALGETWERVPSQLLQYLSQSEPYESGYQISMYGVPSFRKALKEYIFRTEKTSNEFKERIEVAVTWNGTRSAMVDYGRYILDKNREIDETPVFITTDPAWDYKGVFNPLGFKSHSIPLSPINQFSPTLVDFKEAISHINKSKNEYLSFIVINAQHNPTGNNWSYELVSGIIDLCIKNKCGILVDNAYYGITPNTQFKTSAMKILDEKWSLIKESNIDEIIFGVRSLGKQYNCNGWGIGAIWATPTVLDTLVNNYRTLHSYNCNAIFQKAMEKWISSDESTHYSKDLHVEKKHKDSIIEEVFINELNYPPKAIHIGYYTPYVIFEIPKRYQEMDDGLSSYIKTLCMETGVLVTDCWAIPRNEKKKGHLKFVRMYTGVKEDLIKEALSRMVKKGFKY